MSVIVIVSVVHGDSIMTSEWHALELIQQVALGHNQIAHPQITTVNTTDLLVTTSRS